MSAPRHRAPIAVVGVGLRLPGAEGAATLWSLLCRGADATRETPASRWDPDALRTFGPPPRAGLIDDVEHADPALLRLPKREIRAMDPQHRILLECALFALEDAGMPPDVVRGRQGGVFVGLNLADFSRMLARDWSALDAYALLGTTPALAANRISAAFDLRGPSGVTSVGCASSTAAIHEACRALALGEAEFALAGGAELLLSPDADRMLAGVDVLSRSGRCRSLDARADGHLRGEGAAIVALKPADRLGPHDRVYALIRASATNHNGRNAWITAPSAEAQEAVVRACCVQAGVDALDYVETHGSALARGDAVEAEALARALAGPCRLGSLSNNLGYLGAAGGVAQLIKVCLALHHRALPPTIHVEQPNPAIAGPLSVQRILEPWPRPAAGPRRAGVLSTSLGGANAFLLLEEAPRPEPAPTAAGPHLLLLSGHTPLALRRRVAQLLAHLRDDPDADLPAICFTAAHGREHLRLRVAAVADDRRGLLDRLAACDAALHAGDALPAAPFAAPDAPTHLLDAATAWLRGGPAPELAGQGLRWADLPPRPLDRQRLWPEWLTPTLVATDPARGRPRRDDDVPPPTLDLREHTPDDRERRLLELLRHELARLLELEPADLDPARTFFEHGLGSAGLVELRARLTAATSIPLPTAALFEFPRIDLLAAHLAGRAPTHTPQPRPAAAADEPIAIVGAACRFPGAADLDQLADLLWSGRSAIGPVPPDRAALLAAYPDRRGGFLPDVDRFDAEFFRITPREAEGLDPQQRLFLEVAWEALEDAAIPPTALAGTRAGVFAGVHARDYAELGPSDAVGPHWSPGVDASYVAGRLSYFLGLHGPSMAVDTACSSSLTALHLACQSLRAGESTLAIAGGVKLHLAPQLGVFLDRAGALSPSGECRAFDATADGMVQGEGCGVVVLERLSDALRRGGRVLALVRASAVNHDGASGGLTVPNPAAQADLYRAVATRAGLDPAALDYLEAHGTGTRLGDPIELAGVARVYGAAGRERPLLLGSIKPNLGHTEAAAGIAGVLKALLVLARGEVPPNAGFTAPTPEFAWDGAAIAVPRAAQPLPAGRPHLVGVSSFGMSGVNAHAILATPPPAPRHTPARPDLLQFPLAARDEAALRALAARHAAALADLDDADLADYCHTASVGRAALPRRAALTGRTADDLRRLALALAEGRDDPAILRTDIEFGRPIPGASVVRLPTYPWQRARHWWPDPRPATATPPASPSPPAQRDDLTYTLTWAPAPPRAPTPLTGRWWIVDADRTRLALLRDAIRRAGAEPVDLPGPDLAGALLLADGDALDAIHHHWSRLRDLLRAAPDPTRAPRLVLVTRGAWRVAPDDPPPDLTGAPLWALGRVLAHEHPELRGRRIDLDPRAELEPAIGSLLAELADLEGPDELALRPGLRAIPELTRLPFADHARPLDDRPWLITGGLGGIGLALADWLVARGVRRLALLGRSPPRPDVRAKLDALRAAGAELLVRTLDITRVAPLAAALDDIEHTLGPIAGVVHGAGVLADGLFRDLGDDDLARVLAPKVLGASHLHALFSAGPRARALEHFVLLSSTAATLGAPGQANYAVANAYLDALAAARRARGLPGLSVGWGPWADVGMAAADARRGARLAERGMPSLAPAAALAPLARLLDPGAPACALVVDLDLPRWCDAHPNLRRAARLRRLLAAAPTPDPAPTPLDPTNEPLRLRLERLDGDARRAALTRALTTMVADVTRLPADRLTITTTFADLGVDSLMALELRDQLAQDLGVDLPLAEFTDDGSIARLTDRALAGLALARVASARDEGERELL